MDYSLARLVARKELADACLECANRIIRADNTQTLHVLITTGRYYMCEYRQSTLQTIQIAQLQTATSICRTDVVIGSIQNGLHIYRRSYHLDSIGFCYRTKRRRRVSACYCKLCFRITLFQNRIIGVNLRNE